MRARFILSTLVVLLAAVPACGPTDPRQRVLEERVRWSVSMPSGWAEGEDGSIRLTVRLSGPPSTSLEHLTVRFVFQDASGREVDHEWRTFDLTEIERGGPEDLSLRLAPREVEVAGIGIDLVPVPGSGDEPHIEELRL